MWNQQGIRNNNIRPIPGPGDNAPRSSEGRHTSVPVNQGAHIFIELTAYGHREIPETKIVVCMRSNRDLPTLHDDGVHQRAKVKGNAMKKEKEQGCRSSFNKPHNIEPLGVKRNHRCPQWGTGSQPRRRSSPETEIERRNGMRQARRNCSASYTS